VRAATPVGIAIPRLGTTAEVLPLGFEDDGVTMAAPTDPDSIGWYEFSAPVGVAGNAILVGHVDWGGKLRAFGQLRLLRAGDTVVISDSLGRELTYRVQRIQLVKADAPPSEVLAPSGVEEELTLITCGGEFDRVRHQYLSRVIVSALRQDATGHA
jgi:LPXTG-site transpeptidase (sortase) family protein